MEMILFDNKFQNLLTLSCHHCESSNEPTLCYHPLLGVAVNVFLIVIQHELWVFVQLVRPLPLDILKFEAPFRNCGLILEELFGVGWEFLINPLLAWMIFQPIKDLRLLFLIDHHRVEVLLLLLLVRGWLLRILFCIANGWYLLRNHHHLRRPSSLPNHHRRRGDPHRHRPVALRLQNRLQRGCLLLSCCSFQTKLPSVIYPYYKLELTQLENLSTFPLHCRRQLSLS